MKIRVLLLLLFSRFLLCAQENCPDFLFVNHLVNLRDYRLALEVLKEKNSSCGLTDSVNFLKAVCHYNLKEFEHSTSYFSKIGRNSNLYNASVFYSSDNYITLKKYDQSLLLLENYTSNSLKMNELARFELAGISLLERNPAGFEKYRLEFTGLHEDFSNEEKILTECHNRFLEFKPKSKLAAGVLSALIPGAGKAYSGKWGEGLSAFFIVGTLGLVTAENYFKRGIDNPKTIIAGGFFTVFYVGNIWGSVLSIERYRNDFYESQDNIIRASLHIPLSRIFR